MVTDLRERICYWGKSLHRRGFTAGSSGNISVKSGRGYLATPTNRCLGDLVPEEIAELDGEGRHLSGGRPTKEVPLHLAMYRARPDANAVVHLHSTYATGLSCLREIDRTDVLAAITPYPILKLGKVPLVPYALPGSQESADGVFAAAERHCALLIANHGPVVSGNSLDSAVFAAEELEEAAKLRFILGNHPISLLSPSEIGELEAMARRERIAR